MRPPFGNPSTVALVLTKAGVLRLTVQPAGRMPMNHCDSGWRFIDLRRISVVLALVLLPRAASVSSFGVGRISERLGSVCHGLLVVPGYAAYSNENSPAEKFLYHGNTRMIDSRSPVRTGAVGLHPSRMCASSGRPVYMGAHVPVGTTKRERVGRTSRLRASGAHARKRRS